MSDRKIALLVTFAMAVCFANVFLGGVRLGIHLAFKKADLVTVKLGSAQSYLPNPSLTPGVASTSDASSLTRTYGGRTYSQSHRNVTEPVKRRVLESYGVTGKFTGEIDHLVPMCLGGSNDARNLWPEPSGGEWGFERKDLLEKELCTRLRRGTLESVSEAQRKISGNWVEYYHEIMEGEDSYDR